MIKHFLPRARAYFTPIIVLVVLFLYLANQGSVVEATPLIPGAPVDLFDVEAWYGSQIGVPGDPGQTLQAWIEIANTSSTSQWIFIEVWDNEQSQVLLSQVQLVSGNSHYVWVPSWVFKSNPDSYDVRLYYWVYPNWLIADIAVGWIQADQRLQGDPAHFEFSPNEYKSPSWRPEGDDFKWVEQRFWYFDNDYYYGPYGTDRLNRLKQYTSGPLGQLHVEFRRVNASGQSVEGWDALYPDYSLGYCIAREYGKDTNLPHPLSIEHEEMDESDCSTINSDEEAEIATSGTESMIVYSGHDPTNVYLGTNPPIYRVAIKFYRRPAQRNQIFTLQAKYELDEGLDQNGFDIIVPLKYSNYPF